MRTLTRGPYSVPSKGSWLYNVKFQGKELCCVSVCTCAKGTWRKFCTRAWQQMIVTVPYIVQNPHILHCPSIIYGVYERGVKTTFTLVNSARRSRGQGPPLLLYLTEARRAMNLFFETRSFISGTRWASAPHHISRTCNNILQGKMWPELPLYSVSLVKRFSYRFVSALGRPCERASSDFAQNWS